MTSLLDVIDNEITDTGIAGLFDESISELKLKPRLSGFFEGWDGRRIKAVNNGVVNSNNENVDQGAPIYAYISYESSIGQYHHNQFQSGAEKDDIIYMKTTGAIRGVSFSGQLLIIDETRMIFHELSHGVTLKGYPNVVWRDVTGPGKEISYTEELAVFSENLYYANNSSEYRLGHGGFDINGKNPSGGIVGVEMFRPFSAKPSYIGDSISGKFTAVDDATGISSIKTFYKPGKGPVADLSHYIIDRVEFNGSTSLLETTGSTTVLNAGMSSNGASFVTSALDGIMKTGTTAAKINEINAALAAVSFSKAVAGIAFSHSVSVISGISGQRFLEDGNDNNGGAQDPVDMTGPVNLHTIMSASTLEQHADASRGTILIGGSGFVAPDWVLNSDNPPLEGEHVTPQSHNFAASVDNLKGGDRSDILLAGTGIASGKANKLDGGDGDDILIGNAGNDRMLGGEGSDIFIASSGFDVIVGGDEGSNRDVIYYGNLTAGIVYEGGVVAKNSALALDVISGVEVIIGTASSDTFHADGTGMTFIGEVKASTNATSDTYYAADGADTFIDYYAPSGTDNTLDFSNLTVGINLKNESGYTPTSEGSTTAGHRFSGINKIVGTDHEDKFDISALQYGMSVHGGDKADDFTLTGPVFAYGDDGDDIFRMAGNYQRAYGGAGSDRFYITKAASGLIIDGGTNPGTVDILDFSKYTGEVRVNLTSSSFAGPSNINTFTGIEKFSYGVNAMTMTGTTGADVIESGSTKSILDGGAGDDTITVTAADEFTPANHSYYDVTVYGGTGVDHIYAYRAATIYGGDHGDFIWGSNESDVIYGGAGNDTIDAGGGNDYFFEVPNGIDHIDAGEGVDTYQSFDRVSAFDFFLTGGSLEWFGIQKTGVTTDQMLFKQLDKMQFFGSWTADDKFDVSKAIAVLQADEDHFMTGAQLKAAIAASPANRAMADQSYEDPGFSFAPESDPSEAEYVSPAFTPDHDVQYDTYDADLSAWAMQTGVYQAPMHSDWFFI